MNTAQTLAALPDNCAADWMLVLVGCGGELVKPGVWRFADGSMACLVTTGPVEYVGAA